MGDADSLDAVVKPACLERKLNYDGYGSRALGEGLPAIGYDWSSGGVVENFPMLMRGKFGNQAIAVAK